MEKRISDLRNLGPVSERQLAEVGIGDVKTLRATGALDAFARLKWCFPREITVVALYALDGALSDIPWTDLPAARKEALRRFAQDVTDRLQHHREHHKRGPCTAPRQPGPDRKPE